MSSTGEGEVQVPAEEIPTATEETKKPTREKKPRQPKTKTPSHPPYFQMIKEALVYLNEKNGSSPYAIAKYMEEKHKAVLPANFRKILALQLKNSSSRGNLTKIKASYKLSESGKKEKGIITKVAKANADKKTRQRKNTTAAAAAPKRKAAKKVVAKKPKQLKSKIKSPVSKRAKKRAV